MNTDAFARTEHVARTGSTSTDLVRAARAAPDAWPHMSVLLADHQDAGHGRAGREWSTPAGTALTASILLRPLVPPESLGWVTLLAGLAVSRAVTGIARRAGAARQAGAPVVGLKWPNDVVVRDAGPAVPGWGTDRKLAGVLVEGVPEAPTVTGPSSSAAAAGTAHTDLTPASPGTGRAVGPAGRRGRGAVVVGIGVNIRQQSVDLPVPWATSLALTGLAAPEPVDLLATIGRELAALVGAWEGAGGDADAAGLAQTVRAVCVTIGEDVRVDLPGGATLSGTAVELDAGGHLLVRRRDGTLATVLAGDVLHLRRPPVGPPGPM